MYCSEFIGSFEISIVYELNKGDGGSGKERFSEKSSWISVQVTLPFVASRCR